MGIPINYPGLTPEMVKLIKTRSYTLSRGYGHIMEDREDLEQDMALHLLSALPAYNPKKSSLQTFANRVIDYWTNTNVNKWRAECRDYRERGVSLDSSCLDESGELTTLGDMICEDEGLYYAGSLGCIEAVELKILVDSVVSTLSPQLQKLCHELISQKASELCRSRDLSRYMVAYQIKKIRKAFKRVGFDNSVKK